MTRYVTPSVRELVEQVCERVGESCNFFQMNIIWGGSATTLHFYFSESVWFSLFADGKRLEFWYRGDRTESWDEFLLHVPDRIRIALWKSDWGSRRVGPFGPEFVESVLIVNEGEYYVHETKDVNGNVVMKKVDFD